MTVQGRDGAAAAHGCASGRRTVTAIIGADADTAAGLAARPGVFLTPIITGACQHAQAEPGYKPCRRLRSAAHIIKPSKLTDGNSNSRSQVFWYGRARAA